MGRVASVNVGRAQQIGVRRGRPLLSGIVKAPVDGPVRVGAEQLDGDEQVQRRIHGGPDKAVYAYAAEDIAWWEEQLGRELGPGAWFGENLTTQDVDVTGAVVGERWGIGDVELEVCQPRLPCVKLGVRFRSQRMVRAFAHAARPGAYLRVVAQGELRTGDEVRVLRRPAHGITVAIVSRALLLEPALQPVAARATELPPDILDELV
jgi:MOSC domain-containing protein YiiM